MWALVPILPLIPMIVSDYRRYKIKVRWLILFGICVLIFVPVQFPDVLGNLLLILMLVVHFYIFLRLRRIKISEGTSLGDLLFAVCLTPCFDIRAFTWFLISGGMVSIGWWLLFRHKKYVPVVSVFGVCFISAMIIRIILCL